MSIESRLTAASLAGAKPKAEVSQFTKKMAAVWLEALVVEAERNPHTFVECGVSLTPWSALGQPGWAAVGQSGKKAEEHQKKIMDDMSLITPAAFSVELDGTCIRLNAYP